MLFLFNISGVSKPHTLVVGVDGHVLLDHGELGCFSLRHVLDPVATPDTMLAGITALRLAHSQFLSLEKIDPFD